MATNAVRIDLIQFGRKAGVLPSAFKRENIDARDQCMTCRMALRAVDLGMQGGLLPEGRLLLLMMTGDTEFLLRRGVGGQGNGGINGQYRQNSP